jgi:hypothetical protein
MLFAAFQNSIIIGVTTFLDEVRNVDVTIQMFRLNPLPPNLKKTQQYTQRNNFP